MGAKYFLNHNSQQLGPWTHQEVLAEIDAGHLTWTDYIFDEQKKDWVLLFEFAAFVENFKSLTGGPANSEPSSPPNPILETSETMNKGKAEEKDQEEWFVLKANQNKYGPFCFMDLVEMLQKKTLLEFDYVWTTRLDGWKRISETSDFAPDKIKGLAKSGLTEVSKGFFRRRHARAKYGASILLHDNSSVWKGHSLELSPTGAGLLIESDAIQIGQILFLHFKAGDGVPPFNAVCSIVSKQAGKGQEMRYGVKFTSISRSIQVAIKKYTDRAAA